MCIATGMTILLPLQFPGLPTPCTKGNQVSLRKNLVVLLPPSSQMENLRDSTVAGLGVRIGILMYSGAIEKTMTARDATLIS